MDNREHAIVVGGSISGLAAAKVLADRFDRVTILDRDALPDTAADRAGVPHGMHPHLLLIAGRLGLEELFPGLTDELVGGGAVTFDPACDWLFVQGGARRIPFSSGLLGVSMTRAFLESTLRLRVRALPNVEVRERTAVTGLAGGDGRVTGVVLEDRTELSADLVVDATGRGGGADRWLEGLGGTAPDVDTVKVNAGYSSYLARRGTADLPDGAQACLIAPLPPQGRQVGVAFAVEGDRWVVNVGEWHHERMPADPAGFAAFAAGLPVPYLADLIARTEPLGPIETRQFPASRRRYLERLRDLPAGYLAIGDAVCSFNPLYGQGLTVAVLEALELGRCLDRFDTVTTELGLAYHRAIGRIVDTPWQMAAGGDFAFPETTGRRPRGIDLLNRYMRRVVRATHVSPEIHRTILDVQHMLTPPSALLRPATVVKALWAARRSPARRAAAAK